MLKGSKELIRDLNTSLILQTIQQKGPISRAALAKELNFSKATVSTIVQSLMDRKLVLETGSESAGVGRKAILLEFCPDSGYVLSLDIRTSSITAMICDLEGNRKTFLTFPNHADRDQILSVLAVLIQKLLNMVPDCTYGTIGISLAVHGVVHDGQVLFAPYYPYKDIDFVTALEETFSIPVYVENEANLAVLGEYVFSAHCKNLASLSIHSGVGLGLVLEDHLFTGSHGFAGEFGHTTIEVDGRPCPCGSRGCLEQYLSERVLLEDYARIKKLPLVNTATLCQDYRNGDANAVSLIRQFLRYIAVSIHNIQNIINPDLIIINSRITTALPDTLPLLLEMLPDTRNGICPVSYSKLQDQAALLGGVCQCVHRFLKISLCLEKKFEKERETP